MTDNNILELILSEMQGMKSEMQGMKSEMQGMKSELQTVKQKVEDIELTLEHETNRNIQLLAENHSNLIDKLNQSIKSADKMLIYEVQMSSIRTRLDLLEKEVNVLKAKTA